MPLRMAQRSCETCGAWFRLQTGEETECPGCRPELALVCVDCGTWECPPGHDPRIPFRCALCVLTRLAVIWPE